jgi:hypothetical protein
MKAQDSLLSLSKDKIKMQTSMNSSNARSKEAISLDQIGIVDET